MKIMLNYIKHFLVVTGVLLVIGFAIIVSQHGHIGFGTDALAFKVGDEGPHIFVEDDHLNAMYIKGNRDTGFYVETSKISKKETTTLPVYAAFDDSTFTIQVSPEIIPQDAIYNDGEDIIAISDLEGSYRAFRDFLIANKVVDDTLNWTFGKGHLVLVGDMVDRGSSTTQLLWFIYKLEQDAQLQGGKVHYIIGNHELKNLHGNFKSAAPKYLPIAGILGKQQYELFGEASFIGRWLESKNVIEMINNYVFVHGGIHPDIQKLDIDIDSINQTAKQYYRQFYYPAAKHTEVESLLLSDKQGPAWYRGYFKGQVDQSDINASLTHFNAKAIIVGHTIQFKVNTQFDDKVIAIDVKHPQDYAASFPIKRSEGLLISKGKYYRLLDNGEQISL